MPEKFHSIFFFSTNHSILYILKKYSNLSIFIFRVIQKAMKCQSESNVGRFSNAFVKCNPYCKGNVVQNVFKIVFSKNISPRISKQSL